MQKGIHLLILISLQSLPDINAYKLRMMQADPTMIVERFRETSNETISRFSLVGTDTEGYIVEPAGPSTTTPNQDRRIPEGTYNLVWHYGLKHRDVLKLYNEQVSQSRAILIHYGKNGNWTEGCLLPGSSYENGNIKGGIQTLKVINSYFKKYGIGNAQIFIYEP